MVTGRLIEDGSTAGGGGAGASLSVGRGILTFSPACSVEKARIRIVAAAATLLTSMAIRLSDPTAGPFLRGRKWRPARYRRG
jgi:hypothetical protein